MSGAIVGRVGESGNGGSADVLVGSLRNADGDVGFPGNNKL
jgi:hypothetical protein